MATSKRPAPALPVAKPISSPRSGRGDTKTAKFLALVVERHGPLASFPIAEVSKACSDLAPEVGLDAGAARTALRKHVLAAQNGDAT